MRITLISLCLLILCTNCANQKLSSTQKTKTSDAPLLDSIQKQTFKYFWEGAEPNSGSARERIHIDGMYPENDQNVVTAGGTGFGLMGIVVAVERSFISREQATQRLEKILSFWENTPRFKGAWAHWYYGDTGKVKAFSSKDNGGDIVETAFLAQGLIVIREYFKNGTSNEKAIADKADKLWKDIDWNHYTNSKDVIYWHWSPEHNFGMNHAIQGFDECLITYILGAASPSYPIKPSVFENGWNRNGAIKTDIKKYGIATIAKHNVRPGEVGPLFWAHYSFLGLNPIGLADKYISYDSVVHNLAKINIKYADLNPKNYKGYGSSKGWGLTASYSIKGYDAHHPDNDKGVISPTAALSSMPYSPNESTAFARYLLSNLKTEVWGPYGFYDAYSETDHWFPKRYLAIDQGPIVVMIENFRSQLIWNLFMKAPEVKQGLKNLGFTSPYIK